MSAHDRAGRLDSAQLPATVAEALALAGIPPSKLGAARRTRLGDSERDLYFWILRRFATRGRPARVELRQAGLLEAEVERALRMLALEDLIHLGEDGEIAVAYPFSGVPTAHRVRFRSGHEVYAMCALDALGIAPMLGEPVEVDSRDPLTAAPFQARVEPDGGCAWEPAGAVVVAGTLDRCGDSLRGCCPALNFFATAENAERWLSQQPGAHGRVISIGDAIASGRAVFGDVLGG